MLKQFFSLNYAIFVVLHGLHMSSCTCKQTRMNDYLFAQIEQSLSQLKQSTNCGKEDTKYETPGNVYTRWGRSDCQHDATLFYAGYAAGKAYNEGGSGANFLCLPKDPEWKSYSSATDPNRGRIYGVEYEIQEANPYSKNLNDHDMPCVVCLTNNRPTVVMIPGKITCPKGWHKEYVGYIMSQMNISGRTPSEYICADENLSTVPGGEKSRNQAVVYPVEVHCGNLKCPPYVGGRELTCVVCSK